ncbi:MAG: hypothetical protein ACLRPZ_03995 [Coprococcus sp.]
MIITQDDLIKKISEKEDVNVATIRNIFKSAEDIIFDYLSSTSPICNITIKPFSGLSINRKFIDGKNYTKGMFQNLYVPEHVKVKPVVSEYYNKQVNDKLYEFRP